MPTCGADSGGCDHVPKDGQYSVSREGENGLYTSTQSKICSSFVLSSIMSFSSCLFSSSAERSFSESASEELEQSDSVKSNFCNRRCCIMRNYSKYFSTLYQAESQRTSCILLCFTVFTNEHEFLQWFTCFLSFQRIIKQLTSHSDMQAMHMNSSSKEMQSPEGKDIQHLTIL